MLYEQVRTGGCLSYLIGCPQTCAAALIDPELHQLDRYQGLAARHGLHVRYIIDTHTHADHFTGARHLARIFDAPVVMHRDSPAPFADLRLEDGESLRIGDLRLVAMHTPGHTRDSMCLRIDGALFTGDTLLIGGTGRTDLPTGDAEALWDSLFNKVLRLDPATTVYPAHDYKDRCSTTIGDELATNPRLAKHDLAEFVEMMRQLNLSAPTHLTEALRTNMSGGKTVDQLLADCAATVPFLSLAELSARLQRRANDFVILDVRERDAFEQAHIPGARHLPRGQLELRVNEAFPDPTVRILAYCEFGKISTLAAATLRELGFARAVALDGGMKAWRDENYPTEAGPAPGAPPFP